METPEARTERHRGVVISELQFQLTVIRKLNQRMMVIDYRERGVAMTRNPGLQLQPDQDTAMQMFVEAERTLEELYTHRLEDTRTASPDKIEEMYRSVRRYSADVDAEFRRMYLEILRREEQLLRDQNCI